MGLPKHQLELANAANDPEWNSNELASFLTNPGVGRVLCVGGSGVVQIEQILREAHYQVGRLGMDRPPEDIPRAASTFMPDLVYVAVDHRSETSMEVLETIAHDRRTDAVPLVAIVPEDAPAQLIDDAYSRTGCDFFRVGQTSVELLARTHLLVRLARPHGQLLPAQALDRPQPQAANDPSVRNQFRDPATGLYTLDYFVHRLPTEIARARRYGRQLSMLTVRCHAAADSDQTAAEVARILDGHIRKSDIAARLEASLYVMLLPEAGVEKLGALQERIASDLEEAGLSFGMGRAGLDRNEDEGAFSPFALLDTARSRADEPAK